MKKLDLKTAVKLQQAALRTLRAKGPAQQRLEASKTVPHTPRNDLRNAEPGCAERCIAEWSRAEQSKQTRATEPQSISISLVRIARAAGVQR